MLLFSFVLRRMDTREPKEFVDEKQSRMEELSSDDIMRHCSDPTYRVIDEILYERGLVDKRLCDYTSQSLLHT